MDARRFYSLLGISCAVLFSLSCQPKEEAPPPRPSAVLDYTLLGIWPDRYQALAVRDALKEAGIHSQLSGYQPCVINVETSKLEQARAIMSSSP